MAYWSYPFQLLFWPLAIAPLLIHIDLVSSSRFQVEAVGVQVKPPNTKLTVHHVHLLLVCYRLIGLSKVHFRFFLALNMP